MTTEAEADGVWRPERDFNGKWIAVRYTYDRFLNRSVNREEDTEWKHSLRLPRYFDTMEPCAGRCDELNGTV